MDHNLMDIIFFVFCSATIAILLYMEHQLSDIKAMMKEHIKYDDKICNGEVNNEFSKRSSEGIRE